MEIESMQLPYKLIKKKATEFGFTITPKHPHPSDNVVNMMQEEWHLFTEICSPVIKAIPLQMAIYNEDSGFRMLFFPSPCIIQKDNLAEFIAFANVANRYLYRGSAMGRFWVDNEHLDFAYELCINNRTLKSLDPIIFGEQFFDIPYFHFQDLHVPLVMISKNIWKADTAIHYLTDLRENGYVDNSLYGLW